MLTLGLLHPKVLPATCSFHIGHQSFCKECRADCSFQNASPHLWNKLPFHFVNQFNVFMLTICPLIEARCLIQAGGLTAFVPIETGSPIQAGCLIEAGV